eukprot:6025263-Amphidinium_carterae.2
MAVARALRRDPCRSTRHSNTNSTSAHRGDMLHLVAPVHGVSVHAWAGPWVNELMTAALIPCKCAPLWKAFSEASWLDSPLTYHEAVDSLRVLLRVFANYRQVSQCSQSVRFTIEGERAIIGSVLIGWSTNETKHFSEPVPVDHGAMGRVF